MVNKLKSTDDYLAKIEDFVSKEDYYNALKYIEDKIIPIIPDLNRTSPSSAFNSILYNISNIFFLNQRYGESKEYLNRISDLDFFNNSIECIILKALLLMQRGQYRKARFFLINMQKSSWPKEQLIKIQFQIGVTCFRDGNYTEAARYFQDCINHSKFLKDVFVHGCSLYMLGYISFQRCFFDLAGTYYDKALIDFKVLSKNLQLGHTYKMKSILCYRTSRYSDAMVNVEVALKSFLICSNSLEVTNSLLAKARISIFTGNYQMAVSILKQTYRQSKEIGFKRGMAISYEYLGETYYKLDKYDHALRSLKEAGQIAAQIAPEGDIAVEVYRRMAEVLVAQGDLVFAERMSQKTLELAEKLEDKYELGAILRVFGLIAAKENDVDLARSYFNESIITLKMIKESFELARTYRAAAEYYEELYALETIPLEYRTELLEDARSHAVEAMHLYSIQELDEPAAECKELVNRIEGKLTSAVIESRSSHISFDSKWLHSGFVVGRSKNVLAAIAKTGDLATIDIPVLVVGDTGTGKELIARLLHKLSLRARGPFVPVNCASIPETIFESELFGHRKGAFTGAVRDRQGLMEAANGGTLFLDEISELSNQQQAKLLRALQEGMIRRVGETAERPIDVRVISASNDDVESLVATGRIRKDFYYRICVETIVLDPLRRRKDDIPALFAYYLDGDGKEFEVEEGVLELFYSYHWPGNVRELVGVVKILKMLAQESGIIRICDLPLKIRDASSTEHGAARVERSRAIVPRNPINSPDADEGIVQKLILSSLFRC